MMNWHIRDIVAVIFAIGISGSIIILSINEIFHNGHITDVEATTISTVLGAGIGALATYLGAKIHSKDDDDDRDDNQEI